ncbi:5494_t:CDS:2 [Cetraspora pellucida]|uniref:5494_t:CDS:1 n=1 Tax=Cetraspora pellucida TaxID=1433469 RepID=A0A9N9DN91_9GLOM|nr:5494_t:CDS:2 [Cetraspora pellucida]
MSSTHITSDELIITGTIVPELHYEENLSYPIPIRLGLEVMIQFHKNPFIFVYTKTKFSELAYLGLDQNKTAQKLLENVTFCLFIIKLESISIFVSSLDKITHSNKISNHYTASLFYKYKTKQDTSPNAVWQQTGVLKSICGETLFVINHPTTLYNLEQIYKTQFHYQISIPNNCTVADWDNEIIMNHLFELYLKKAVSKSNEEWHQVFQSWKQQKSNIIELYTHIRKTYGQDHEFRNREL